jgi:hypothetical protein
MARLGRTVLAVLCLLPAAASAARETRPRFGLAVQIKCDVNTIRRISAADSSFYAGEYQLVRRRGSSLRRRDDANPSGEVVQPTPRPPSPPEGVKPSRTSSRGAPSPPEDVKPSRTGSRGPPSPPEDVKRSRTSSRGARPARRAHPHTHTPLPRPQTASSASRGATTPSGRRRRRTARSTPAPTPWTRCPSTPLCAARRSWGPPSTSPSPTAPPCSPTSSPPPSATSRPSGPASRPTPGRRG